MVNDAYIYWPKYIYLYFIQPLLPQRHDKRMLIFLWSDHYINLGEHLELWVSVLCDICDTQQIEQGFDVILQCPHFTNLLTKYLREY